MLLSTKENDVFDNEEIPEDFLDHGKHQMKIFIIHILKVICVFVYYQYSDKKISQKSCFVFTIYTLVYALSSTYYISMYIVLGNVKHTVRIGRSYFIVCL